MERLAPSRHQCPVDGCEGFVQIPSDVARFGLCVNGHLAIRSPDPSHPWGPPIVTPLAERRRRGRQRDLAALHHSDAVAVERRAGQRGESL